MDAVLVLVDAVRSSLFLLGALALNGSLCGIHHGCYSDENQGGKLDGAVVMI